jgi:hypothetical protein
MTILLCRDRISAAPDEPVLNYSGNISASHPDITAEIEIAAIFR